MLELRVYGGSDGLARLGAWLEQTGMVRHLALAPMLRTGNAVLTGDIRPESVDLVLGRLEERGYAGDVVAIVRVEDITPPKFHGRPVSLIWADMVGQARHNARPVARYLAFMMAAGVIAAYGVVTGNSTLIVGAMAVSPDTLPVTAACVGLISRQAGLAGRGLLTLAVGLTATMLAAAAIALLLRGLHHLPAGFDVGETSLDGLVTIGVGTIGVALAAGIAAMLALETRASSAVGVAISVTTIPAAAYFGVAAGLGELSHAWGALAVLGVNVAMLLVGGTLTLAVQRTVMKRSPDPHAES